jgi:hypothetical protein
MPAARPVSPALSVVRCGYGGDHQDESDRMPAGTNVPQREPVEKWRQKGRVI